MKSIIFVNHFIYLLCISYLACFTFYVISERKTESDCKCDLRIKNIELPVDHFDGDNKMKWKMRYMQNTVYWKEDSVIFLYIGGHKTLVERYLLDTALFDMAKEFQAAIFATEHRYYGQSDTATNLTYLTTRQALADLKVFIKYIKQQEQYKHSKVVAIGDGYGGTLAVWMKVEHPNAIDVVLASSAPLMAKVDDDQYLFNLGQAYLLHTPEKCTRLIGEVFVLYNKYIKEKNFEKLKQHAAVCKDVNLEKLRNQQVLFLSIHSTFMKGLEGGIPQMLHACNLFEVYHGNVLNTTRIKQKIAPFNAGEEFFWRSKEKCMDVDMDNLIAKVKQPCNKNMKSWWYQCCTQFGLFPTTKNFNAPFEDDVTLDFYFEICTKLFGVKFEISTLVENVLYTNARYGGTKPQLSNAIYVHGEIDPWSTLGATESSYNNTAIIVVPNESRSTILGPRSLNDLNTLIDARKKLVKSLRHILNSEVKCKKKVKV